MVKHSFDSPNPLGQITPSAEKHNRVERNTDTGQMFLVRGEKVTQLCLPFPGLEIISAGSPLLSMHFPGGCPLLEPADFFFQKCFVSLQSEGMGTWGCKFILILLLELKRAVMVQ